MNVLLWLSVLIMALIVEACTMALTSIWFAVGAFFALCSVYCGISIKWQICVFLGGCFLSLVFLRPLIKKHLFFKKEKTNVDRIIGTNVVVTEDINNFSPRGQIMTSCGQLWTAISEDGSDLHKGDIVTIIAITGVKVICRKAKL